MYEHVSDEDLQQMLSSAGDRRDGDLCDLLHEEMERRGRLSNKQRMQKYGLPSNHRLEDRDEVAWVISQVRFAPSCLDMGWEWEVEPVISASALGGVLSGKPAEASVQGWNVRCSFRRPDTDTGEVGRGFGRWWFVAEGTTVSGLVKTMWAACKMIVEHELHEAFMFKGVRVFDPHVEVDSLLKANKAHRA